MRATGERNYRVTGIKCAVVVVVQEEVVSSEMSETEMVRRRCATACSESTNNNTTAQLAAFRNLSSDLRALHAATDSYVLHKKSSKGAQAADGPSPSNKGKICN